MAHTGIERRSESASGLGGFGVWARAVWRAWQSRRAAAKLARLDDRLLADVGLTRGDVNRALSLPLWQDATRELNRIAWERRQGWRR
jgi:uncharacterized protein YjiS (DUF1127 family)